MLSYKPEFAYIAFCPMFQHGATVSQRHADAMARSRRAVLASIAELQLAQDQLLDRLVIESH